jgi:hypothetical protein
MLGRRRDNADRSFIGSVAMSDSPIHIGSYVKAQPTVVVSELADGAALLDLDKNIYYGLNEVAAQIWTEIQDAKRVGELEETVKSKFDAGGADVVNDIVEMLTDMNKAGLISVDNAPPA